MRKIVIEKSSETKVIYFTPMEDTFVLGLRYFIARRFGAHVGFDIAKGPEDTVFYLQFGHAWR